MHFTCQYRNIEVKVVFSILVIIRVVHLMEQGWINLIVQIALFQRSSKRSVSKIMSHNQAWPNSFRRWSENSPTQINKDFWTRTWPLSFAAHVLLQKFAADILPQKLSHKNYANKIGQLKFKQKILNKIFRIQFIFLAPC